MALWRQTRTYEAIPGPWLNQTVTDHNISRIGLFVVCCLTLGAFYVGLVKLPVSHMARGQELPNITNPLEIKHSPAALSAPVPTTVPSAAPTHVATAAAVSPAPASAPPVATAPLAVSPAPVSARPSAQPSVSARPAPAASHSAAEDSYTVQAGDTLFSIARQHHVSVQALAAANKVADVTLVKTGQKLEIP